MSSSSQQGENQSKIFIAKAITLIQSANAEYDLKNYNKALDLYKQGLQFLMQAYKCTSCSFIKQLIFKFSANKSKTKTSDTIKN